MTAFRVWVQQARARTSETTGCPESSLGSSLIDCFERRKIEEAPPSTPVLIYHYHHSYYSKLSPNHYSHLLTPRTELVFVAMKSSSLKKQPSLQDLRTAACELSAAGISQRDIAAQLGKSVWWVGKWVGRRKESKSMTDLPRSGRPRKTAKEEDDRVVELLEDSGVGSLRRVKRKLGEEGVNVGRETIRQRALEKAKKYKKKPPKPLLTSAQKEKRLKFAKRELRKGATSIPSNMCSRMNLSLKV